MVANGATRNLWFHLVKVVGTKYSNNSVALPFFFCARLVWLGKPMSFLWWAIVRLKILGAINILMVLRTTTVLFWQRLCSTIGTGLAEVGQHLSGNVAWDADAAMKRCPRCQRHISLSCGRHFTKVAACVVEGRWPAEEGPSFFLLSVLLCDPTRGNKGCGARVAWWSLPARWAEDATLTLALLIRGKLRHKRWRVAFGHFG